MSTARGLGRGGCYTAAFFGLDTSAAARAFEADSRCRNAQIAMPTEIEIGTMAINNPPRNMPSIKPS